MPAPTMLRSLLNWPLSRTIRGLKARTIAGGDDGVAKTVAVPEQQERFGAEVPQGKRAALVASADRGSVTQHEDWRCVAELGNRMTAEAAATTSTRTEARESWLGRFLDYQELIGFHGVQHLMDAGRPANLDVNG